MKIGNVIIDKKIFMTLLIIFVVVTGFVGYSYLNSDLSSALALNVDEKICVQENLNDRLRCLSNPDNMKSKYVTNSNGVDFSSVSSDTNGKGLYMLSSTMGDTYPISYYRGAVTNNNVKFGGYCWKIVRTTETGGTKLIYNGKPDGSGYCSATIGSDTYVSNSPFNSNYNSPSYNGYRYGKVYPMLGVKVESNAETQYTFGNSFSYSNGSYTLSNQTTDISSNSLKDNHYTCFNTTGVCQNINYVFFYNQSYDKYMYYITLENGESVTDALNNMVINPTYTDNSTIMDYLEDWYDNYLSSYASFIEDTVWCNDKNRYSGSNSGYLNNGWNPTNGYIGYYWYYNSITRIIETFSPTMECRIKDSFTVNSSASGNGELNRPIGLITVDELLLAGLSQSTENTNNYLFNDEDYWTMTPSQTGYNSAMMWLLNKGNIDSIGRVHTDHKIRPSISLRKEVVLTGGDGSSTNPYTVDLPFTPSQVSYAKPGSFTTTYDSSTLTMNVDLTTSGGWEYIVKPLSVKKGKNYRISLDYTISNDYTGYSSFSGIGLQVVDSTLSYITTANAGATGPLNEVRITNNKYLNNTAGTYSETIDFTAGEENYFIINCGMAGDDQTINFKISNFYIREI